MIRGICLSVLGCLAAGPTVIPLTAQTTAGLSGRLLDRASRQPLVNASIVVVGTRVALRSDTSGWFRQTGFAPGTYVVQARALGYAPGSWILELAPRETLTVVIELDAVPLTLPGVTVEGRRSSQRGLAGFEQRRLGGHGVFLNEDDISRINASRLSDLLRSVPGVKVACRYSGCRVRMSRGDCQPDYFVDGLPASNSTSPEMPVVGVVAMEIYRTSTETPFEFLRANNTCGAIVIWTTSGL